MKNFEMYTFISTLYPICRSITGNGVRKTLNLIKREIPLHIVEVPTNMKVFDWKIPQEWNIKNAYVKNSQGQKVIDFSKSNLHVVNYSIPIHKKMNLDELKKHIFTNPKNPNVIPYRTNYYEKSWGFCMTHKKLRTLKEDTYEVFINSSLKNGSLSYGELLIKGKSEEEIVISTHICHPSLCNDNLSGIAVATKLAKTLMKGRNYYSYRFLFVPGTIGSIAWLSKNEKKVHKIKGGFVLSGVGDSGIIHYKKSRKGDSIIDNAFANVLRQKKIKSKILDFSPFGYDERQYCSPGFNLPIGCLMRSVYGTYPQYHTSADNLDFVKEEYLAESFTTCMSVITEIETDALFLNVRPQCEPQLGTRGLYKTMNDQKTDVKKMQLAMLWVLNLSDGNNSLRTISHKSTIPYPLLEKVAHILVQHKLLKVIK